MTNIQELLTRLGACDKPLAWIALPENEGKTPEELWETCLRGDWLMWLVEAVELPRKLVALAVCDHARLGLQYIPDGENAPRLCIEAGEEYLRGTANIGDVIAAYIAAEAVAEAYSHILQDDYAANGPACYAAHAAKYAVGYIANSADRVAYLDIGTTDAACYVENAADIKGYSDAGYTPYTAEDSAGYGGGLYRADGGRYDWRSETQEKCANLTRARISWQVVSAGLNKTTACGGCSELKGCEL